ncbi:MAG: TetR/AcrR family transcriptional regulator [Halobacteriales archaeon]|nr:TetR/AcrR family transcriptional regulator [Halobacteriales archaeon]
MDTEMESAVMAATSRALCEHGYADLTMQRIADEWDKSKAALHYHYDTKEELLESFLDWTISRFESRLACEAADPRERLDTFVEALFGPAESSDGSFAIALLAMKVQAPHSTTYRDRLVEMDERMRETLAETLRDGIEAGYFRDVNPEDTARFAATAINGSHVRQVALDERPTEARQLFEQYLDETLGREPTTEVSA